MTLFSFQVLDIIQQDDIFFYFSKAMQVANFTVFTILECMPCHHFSICFLQYFLFILLLCI